MSRRLQGAVIIFYVFMLVRVPSDMKLIEKLGFTNLKEKIDLRSMFCGELKYVLNYHCNVSREKEKRHLYLLEINISITDIGRKGHLLLY